MYKPINTNKMGKVKQWSVEKKDAIEGMLINMWASLGMDIPSNYEDIVQYCYEDVCETADPDNWHSGDVAIAFRRWIEEQDIPKKGNTRPNYFEVVAQGWNEGLEREEIQIHCGENGNLMIVKTPEGFGFDAFDVNGENINTMAVWEDDINPLDEDDLLEESNAPENFSEVELTDFKDEWGQYNDEICANLDIDEEGAEDYLMGDYFWLDGEEKWYPKCSSGYSEREQAIADYLRVQ
jgi:hypothetical protein